MLALWKCCFVRREYFCGLLVLFTQTSEIQNGISTLSKRMWDTPSMENQVVQWLVLSLTARGSTSFSYALKKKGSLKFGCLYIGCVLMLSSQRNVWKGFNLFQSGVQLNIDTSGFFFIFPCPTTSSLNRMAFGLCVVLPCVLVCSSFLLGCIHMMFVLHLLPRCMMPWDVTHLVAWNSGTV